ncbi:ComEC family protein [Candidatus Fukatsuia endosymbiont of Tuberolachnus salignus]|uniref:ComEC family protein n=1 Tax=Candidatus Fukatsuia endosymbiont of Tuberolachnus salignus TaxID=3077957 RepID=UPI00313BC4CD
MAIAVVCGMLPLILLPQLPEQRLFWVLAVLVIVLWLSRNLICWYFALAIISFLWGCWHGTALLTQTNTLSQGDKQVIATVKSINLSHHDEQKVLLAINQLEGKYLFPPVGVFVIWQNGLKPFCAGQQWRFKLRMRPTHSLLNQGGFDSQRWAIANRQPLSGKIISAEPIDNSCNLRQKIVTMIQQQISTYDHRAILLALAFGERALLNQQNWQQLRQTGTAHLMAISGLHIAIAALFGALLARALQFSFPVHWIGLGFPLLFSWLLAISYVWLAGASPPTLRAALALTLWLALRRFGILSSAWQVWIWTLSLILITDPLAVLSDSFWLSCLAVAALIFWWYWMPLTLNQQKSWRGLARRWLHLQLGMMLLLMPLQVGLFHGLNISSLVANLWAVPIISFITVPIVLMALVTSFIPVITSWLWYLADLSISVVFFPLNVLQKSWLTVGKNAVLISCSGWLAVIIWRFQWWRSHTIAVLTLCLVLWLFSYRPQEYRWRVDMLDVGHGLAVIIERHGKAIIFDTGMRWKTGSMASRAILPYLSWHALNVEQIIISHDHKDHSGGLSELMAAFPQAMIRAPFFPAINGSQRQQFIPCRQGDNWQWQGLHFEVLWPHDLMQRGKNDDSCVVRINDGKHSILLTGDLEKSGEYQLVQELGNKLTSTILQVPHHGSQTSSTPPFLRAVKPELAFASVARYSPWRLPARKIVLRYRKNNIIWRDTSVSGQLSLFFFDDKWRISGYREQLMPRWYHQWFGVREHYE